MGWLSPSTYNYRFTRYMCSRTVLNFFPSHSWPITCGSLLPSKYLGELIAYSSDGAFRSQHSLVRQQVHIQEISLV